jgi:outer membrane immunogenic protein
MVVTRRLLGWAVLSAFLIVARLSPAGAADLLLKAPPHAPPIYSWTGCYLGIENGGGWGESRVHAASSARPALAGLPITNPFDVGGALIGGTVGCNYQIANVVLGIEDDFSWTNGRGSAHDVPPFNVRATNSIKEDWMDTLRGRVGLTWGRLLVYGTGGAAVANVGLSVCTSLFCVSDSQTRIGWTAGLGGEWVVWADPARTFTLKVEYLHANFGTGLFINPPVIVGNSTVVSRNVSLTEDFVRAGVNWKFATAPAPTSNMALRALKATPALPVSAWSWTGCYIGANIGGAWDKISDIRTGQGRPLPPQDYGSDKGSAFVAGDQAGCDYQVGKWIVGVEGQYDWGKVNSTHVIPPFPGFSYNTTLSNFATLAGRAGYTVLPQAFLYGKAGDAWTRDNLIVTIPASSGLSEFANVNFTGWTIGGGLEWLALPNVSLFAEYEFIDFHAKSVTFTTPPGNVGAPDVITHSQKNVEALLAGVNVRCCDRALR